MDNAVDDKTLEFSQTDLRFLTPETCQLYRGPFGALHLKINGEQVYGGIYATYAFPVTRPSSYISMIHTGGELDEQEVGVIRDLDEFPDEQAVLVRESLARQYFVHTVTSLKKVGWQYGMVAFEAETDKGPAKFFVPWKQKQAVDYGKLGKVLIDVEDNRYLIPDLGQMSARKRREFLRYIYW